MSRPQFLIDYYFLHEEPDGTEVRSPRPIGLKRCQRVTVMLDYEECSTTNTVRADHEMRALLLEPVPPIGKGWVQRRRYPGQPNDLTVWRRPGR